MKITLNGQLKEFPDSENLSKLISCFCKKPEHTIAELNGQIIKNKNWPETLIKDGDSLELVTLVGGG